MKRLPLTMACGPYDRMEALWQGAVQPEGIDLRYLHIQSPPEIFARMIKTHSFDVAEMSLAHYCIMRTRGDFPFVAMPISPLAPATALSSSSTPPTNSCAEPGLSKSQTT